MRVCTFPRKAELSQHSLVQGRLSRTKARTRRNPNHLGDSLHSNLMIELVS